MGNRLSRRALLRQTGCGFGLLGLQSLLSASPLLPREPHFTPRVKRVIFLFMHGGPSHLDTFDPKPRLYADNGKPVPFKRGLTFGEGSVNGLMKPLWEFQQHGQSAIPVSSLFPNVAKCADDLCVIRSMVGDGVDHGAALLQLHTGVFSFKRPSLGAWLLYGLGTENQNLPGFVTIKPSLGHGGQNNWSNSFLPGEFQGTALGNSAMKVEEIANHPVPYLGKAAPTDEQWYELELLRKINRTHVERNDHDPELEARIQAFELAFRMQAQAPQAFEVEKESDATKRLYGYDNPVTRDFAWQCMLARRLCERGVRVVQCWHSYKWDQHSELLKLHTQNAAEVDQPIGGLLTDLKGRGLLSDTLVIWGGEFGRTPWAQNEDGRDHNPYGYTIWMAGAGIKRGFIYGATDDFGYHAVENRMHLHDLHATVLHLMGLDHLKLTYPFGGRQFRLTDVAGSVHHEIFS